ncbi:hypothetical protein [Motilimonas sp. KMU-193]|uniref:hypothetical protein n=1 Tax=Motilimonas sp. KMU-193 TaxID=3388668 RepID=UPI00396B3882
MSLIDTSELTAFGKKRAYNYGLDDAIENNLLQTRYPNYLHNPAGSMAYVPELVVKLDGREAVFKVSPFMGDENNKQSEINQLKKVAEAALKKLGS